MYEFEEYTTTEGQGSVRLCAVIMNFADGSPRPFTISATTQNGNNNSNMHSLGQFRLLVSKCNASAVIPIPKRPIAHF